MLRGNLESFICQSCFDMVGDFFHPPSLASQAGPGQVSPVWLAAASSTDCPRAVALLGAVPLGSCCRAAGVLPKVVIQPSALLVGQRGGCAQCLATFQC